jgi:hypothetical protein
MGTAGGPKREVTFSWEEGKYFDLWMVVHALAGMVLGFATLLFLESRILAYVIGFILLVINEVAEKYFKIHEAPENRVLDIVVGIIFFAIAYELSFSLLERTSIWALFVYSLIILGILSLLGWLDKKRREGS